jgi:ATP-dependent exoDNAse (exonuclease V), alpha subunit - helicase superfamily I member
MVDVIEWDETQTKAIEACCDTSRRVVAVTGKAGTGKTLMMREVAQRLRDAGYSVQSSAPTGKAAKRIREATQLEAVTNHRLLGYGMPDEVEVEDELTGNKKTVQVSTGPRYNRRRPLHYDVLLTDEYAMVNQEIHDSLLAALKPGARICMFGDANQLKPIEEDRRLDQLPSSFQRMLEKFDGITLDTIHRHDAGSGIARNGSQILLGRMPRSTDDFHMRTTDQPVRAVQEFVELSLAQGHSYADVDHQIITSMNKSWIGTQRLNLVVQAMFWDRTRPFIELPRHRWVQKDVGPIRVQVGSKVVYTANSYDLDGTGEAYAFNGELGVVHNINFEDGSVEIDFGDRTVVVPPLVIIVRENGTVVEQDPRRNIDHAYVLTTHKCQGSEFQHVCYVMNKSTLWSQSRRNFYTAITRARQQCTVFADMQSIAKSTKFPG